MKHVIRKDLELYFWDQNMFVKYIILDGFKSYARETTVGPFDEHFNAITGLNGTGKSNILDAICFVLGISSLSTVRTYFGLALSVFIIMA